jgi:hypothetical protein
MRFIACIKDPVVIKAKLAHLPDINATGARSATSASAFSSDAAGLMPGQVMGRWLREAGARRQ